MFHSNKLVNWDLNPDSLAPESFSCIFFQLIYATNLEGKHSGHACAVSGKIGTELLGNLPTLTRG